AALLLLLHVGGRWRSSAHLLCKFVMRLTVVGLSTRETEGVGFEPTVGFPTLDFESSALNRTQPPFPVADTLDLILRCAILRCGSEVHLATEVRLTASQARSIPPSLGLQSRQKMLQF